MAENDRLEDLMTQLIKNVASLRAEMNEHLDASKSDLTEIKDAVIRIEHKLNVLERRQDKMGTRLDNIEAEVEIMHEGNQ